MDNFSIAVLVALNTLAERHDLEPHDFVATMANDVRDVHLRFEAPPSDQGKRRRFDSMLLGLGISLDNPVLSGDEATVWTKLRVALRKAPRRSR